MKQIFTDNKLRIAITNVCNLSCFYCHNEGQSHFDKAQFIGPDFIAGLVKLIKENNIYVESVNLTGGEPLLHPDLFEIIDSVSQITDDIRINTNGTLLTYETIDKLIRHKVTGLKIGWDSFSKSASKPSCIAEKQYESDRSEEKIADILRYAKDKCKVVLNTVVTSFNLEEIHDIITTACSVGLKRIKILKLHDMDSRELNQSSDTPEAYKTNQPQANAYYGIFNYFITHAVRVDEHPEKGRTDMFFRRRDLVGDNVEDDLFEIRFCEDICKTNACQVMFTEITSDEKLLICPKYHIYQPIDLRSGADVFFDAVQTAVSKQCSNRKRLLSERFRSLDDHALVINKNTVDGIIVRSSCPAAINLEYQKYLFDHGYRNVIDLRRDEEVREQQSPYKTGNILKYYHAPLMPLSYSVKSETAGRGEEYYNKLLKYRENAENVFTLLAGIENKTIIHCSGGKSRTGVISAVLLLLKHLDADTIADDYCTAYFDLYGMDTYLKKSDPGRRDISEFIDCIKKNHSTVEGFLKTLGLTEPIIDKLKEKLNCTLQ